MIEDIPESGGHYFSRPSNGGPVTRPPGNSMDVNESRFTERRDLWMNGHDKD